MKILIINGPNLNLLGVREPGIYGTESMESILARLRRTFAGTEIEYFQSNHEGALIDRIQSAAYGADRADAIVLNAGGYTHTSVSLADAVAAVNIPVVEVHLSNVAAREEVRHHSLLSAVCTGTVTGFGARVYELGIRAVSADQNEN